MWSIVLWHSCVFVCAECGNANYRVPECLENPFCAPAISAFGQKEYPNFRFGPSYRSLLLKPILSLF
ncbi:CPA_1a_G0000070.mRNA.1.CDS.1 [Saccharomyces cerevisiae]|nr:CPA_1a_G0000070.mRNA.1.CDS.1 [Saccharomyces cerevisiae]CAI7122998.1 CPA_1a_G0000070.mRNA.1.CDS.1 [Saccharomyces cerevisiae]